MSVSSRVPDFGNATSWSPPLMETMPAASSLVSLENEVENTRYCERETNRDKYADGDCVAHGFHELAVRLVCEEVRAVNGKIGYNGRAILDRERRIPVEQRLRRSSLRLEVLRADASAFLYEKDWPLVLVEDVHEEGVGHVGKERRFERGFREASVQAVCLRNHRDENRLKVFLLFPVPVHD